MANILMVSKPIAPPWDDGSKNLVRALAGAFERHRATVMTRRGTDAGLTGVAYDAVYAGSDAAYAPGLVANARVLARLLHGAHHDLWHFFFAPNPRSSRAAAWAARARRMRTVQTVCSAPAASTDLDRVLFGDRVVVLSKCTERRFLSAGVECSRVVRIPPAVAPLSSRADTLQQARAALRLHPNRPLIVYPGDLEFSAGAERIIRAHAALGRCRDGILALACRNKTSAAQMHERRLRALSHQLGAGDRVVSIGHTPHILDLLAMADVVALPAETLHAKVDLPLVLIEAMLLGRTVVTIRGTAAEELAEAGAAVAIAPDVDELHAVLGELLDDAERRAQIGALARAAALARYHPSVVARAYEALYDGLLAGARDA